LRRNSVPFAFLAGTEADKTQLFNDKVSRPNTSSTILQLCRQLSTCKIFGMVSANLQMELVLQTVTPQSLSMFQTSPQHVLVELTVGTLRAFSALSSARSDRFASPSEDNSLFDDNGKYYFFKKK
jgi:hypothetical protein